MHSVPLVIWGLLIQLTFYAACMQRSANLILLGKQHPRPSLSFHLSANCELHSCLFSTSRERADGLVDVLTTTTNECAALRAGQTAPSEVRFCSLQTRRDERLAK